MAEKAKTGRIGAGAAEFARWRIGRTREVRAGDLTTETDLERGLSVGDEDGM